MSQQSRPDSGEVYTHGHHESVLRSHTSRTAANSAAYLIPHLSHGSSVLDVGSGPGTITADFARLVAPGPVLGIDRAPEVVAAATAHARDAHLANLSFDTGDVNNLDFPDDSFDIVHAHQLMQHLRDPVEAMRQMRRVAKPGGLIAVRDADFGGMFWYPELPQMAQWMQLYQRVARHNQAEPNAGRRLLHWARAAGFTSITASSANWLYAAPQERDWLAGMWAERTLNSAFAEQAMEYGLADRETLEHIAAGWRLWGGSEDGWFIMPNSEILARV